MIRSVCTVVGIDWEKKKTDKDERNEESDDSQTYQSTNHTTCNGAGRTARADFVVSIASSNGRAGAVNICRGNIAEGTVNAVVCGGWAGDNGRGGLLG